MEVVDFEQTLDKILAADSRYKCDAYYFVREALDHTHELRGKGQKGALRHVSGPELLEGIRDCGLRQFGPMTLTVFEEWGVHGCEDFGEIVFNMVEYGLLGKTEEDSRDDFKGGYDFFEAFRLPFLPASKAVQPAPESQSSKA